MTRPVTAIKSKHKSNFTREDVSYANFAQQRLAEIGHLLMIRTEIARLECPWEEGNCKLVVTRGRLYQRLSSSSALFLHLLHKKRKTTPPPPPAARARTIFPFLPDLSGFHSLFPLPCPFLSCLSFLLFFLSFILGSLLTDFPAVTKARLKCSSLGASHRMCRVKPQATGSS